jgi:hypothetical protein
VFDLQQMGDGRVTLGLDQQFNAAVRIIFIPEFYFRHVDQNDHRISGRCARHHVACVLFVARRVGDDELAFRRGEIAIRDVDRDALFAFCFQTVGQ